MTSAPIYGLILAGGLSSRMQRDKAALAYGGRSQLDRAYELASRHASKVYVSVRANQTADPARAHYPMIVDTASGDGPIAGIRSAFEAYPHAAWLVLACDLPFASDAVIEHLLANRDTSVMATAYASTHDGLPEPLCAVWEPSAAPALAAFHATGKDCPRKFLLRHSARILEPVDARALDNVNTPEEYAQALAALDVVKPMQLKIQYYALMREQAGRSEETLETAAATPAALYVELTTRYGFTLPREQLKVAVNSEFADWSRPLSSGDAVVFIPPVAGG
jgi:molybdopterin-guanine dinucleotide biosynthesis protein A